MAGQSVTIKTYAKERQKEIIDGLALALRRAAIVVENQAKENVDQTPPQHPQVQTGRLRASIASEVTQSGNEIEGRIGTNVFYGKILEHGSVKMPAYPWLFPALETSKPKIVEILKGAGAKNITIG